MLERRLTDAADGVREALRDLVPPPITDLVGATARTDASAVAGGSPLWRGPLIAVGTAAAVLAIAAASMLLLASDGGDYVIQPAPTTPAPTTTVTPIENDRLVVPTTVDAAWSLQGTLDDWMTEPVLADGMFFAMRKGLDDDAQPNGEGVVEGLIEEVGELWTSPDGVTWVPAEAGDQKPAAPAATPTEGAAVEVRRNPTADNFEMLVADGLWATTDGASWREITLRPSNDNWVPIVTAGRLGWLVYSPPVEASVEADGSSVHQGPRNGNLGLWYTPDTEAWFEVTNLGPLERTYEEVGEVTVLDTAMVVRESDVLVYAYIGENIGFGIIANPHTEVWRLELSMDASIVTQESVPSTTNPAVVDDGVASPDEPVQVEWNPILATTKATTAPPAATCPDGATPDLLGPIGQARPWGASWSNQAAVFDQHAGRVIFVDEAGETWAFDVCTNTWRAMNPNFDTPSDLFPYLYWPSAWSGQLVYDVDSDVTIGFQASGLAVYDASANTWTIRPQPDAYETGVPGLGAVYDPVSGLVVVQTASSGLVAYDVETDIWTPIGGIEDKDWPSFLVGYLAETDQFVFLIGYDADPGAVIDPRTGVTAELATPFDDMFAAYGRLNYATSTDTPYVLVGPEHPICRVRPATLEWDCLTLADGPEAPPNGVGVLAAIVGDPINDRVILINGSVFGSSGASSGEGYHGPNDIWAVDFATGEWTQLLERTGTMTYEELNEPVR